MVTKIEHGEIVLQLNDNGTIDVMGVIRKGRTYVVDAYDHGKVVRQITGGCFEIRQEDTARVVG